MVKRKRLMKWKFYVVAVEEFTSYVDEDEISVVLSDMSGILRDHQPRPTPKDINKNYPYYIMCSVEELVSNKIVSSMRTKGRQKCARRRSNLDYCSNKNFQIMAHTCAPDRMKVGMMSNFLGMSCFEITHTLEAQYLFTCIHRKGKSYLRAIPSHPIFEEVNDTYTQDIWRQTERPQPRGRPRAMVQN